MMEKLVPFFYAIAGEKDFGCDRENHVSMGGQGRAKVKYQAGKFFPLSNRDIDAMNKAQLYSEILQRGNK